MYNIKQLTNYNTQDFPTETKAGAQGAAAEYIVISNSSLGGNIVKFGYCANDQRGIGYPIYFTIGGVEKKVFIGKTGMYEVNIEEYYTDNDAEKTIKVQITNIKVPKEIFFTLDYLIEI